MQCQERLKPNWTSDKTIVIVSNSLILQEAILPDDIPIKNKQIIVQSQSLQDPYQATMISSCKWIGSQWFSRQDWLVDSCRCPNYCLRFAIDSYSCFLINM